VVNSNNGALKAINYIPVVMDIKGTDPVYAVASRPVTSPIDGWAMMIAMIGTGCVIMLLRLIMQFISLMRIKSRAVMVSKTGVNIYHVDDEISPFSFGNGIYINKTMHTPDELEEIILHEYVHVKQKHTIDILLAEMLCIITWYNPFAWLMRHAIKQNLEFIADDNVVRSGLDKKAYQYHLLQVVGIPQYSITNQFNFSSLKKRIMMMNHVKSAKINLVRFLFILPLLAVTLVAFRDKIRLGKASVTAKKVSYAVIFYDMETYKPISNVTIKSVYNKTGYLTDANGYAAIPLTVTPNNTLLVSLAFSKAGYESFGSHFSKNYGKSNASSIIAAVGLRKYTTGVHCTSCITTVDAESEYTGGSLAFAARDFYTRAVMGQRLLAVRMHQKTVGATKFDTIHSKKNGSIQIDTVKPPAAKAFMNHSLSSSYYNNRIPTKLVTYPTNLYYNPASVDTVPKKGSAQAGEVKKPKLMDFTIGVIFLPWTTDHKTLGDADVANFFHRPRDTARVTNHDILQAHEFLYSLTGGVRSSKAADDEKGTTFFSADTMSLSSKNVFEFSGNVVTVSSGRKIESTKGECFGPSSRLIVVDGVILEPGKYYVNLMHPRYHLAMLPKDLAIQKYGDKGAGGVLEINSK
jgi:hypothetical protein